MNNNQLTVRVKELTTRFSGAAYKQRMNDIAGSGKGDLILSNTISSLQQNPKLAECTESSIISAALAGHALGLNFATHEAYFVPFNNNDKGVKEAQFQIGWKGYIQLAERSGQYQKINALELKEGELKHFDRLTEDYEIEFIEDDEEREKLPSTHYIAYIKLNNGFTKVMIWTKKKMEAHALKYSQLYKMDKQKGWTSSHWSKNFDAMAIKTMLRQIIDKFGVKSVEMSKALVQDQATLKLNDENEVEVESYVDNLNTDTDTGEIVVDEVKEETPQEPQANQDQINYLLKKIDEKNANDPNFDKVNFIREKHGVENINEIPLSKCKEMLRELGVNI